LINAGLVVSRDESLVYLDLYFKEEDKVLSVNPSRLTPGRLYIKRKKKKYVGLILHVDDDI
jgi:hypothetical protein